MTGRYKAYPEYKESNVEWSDYIPKSWVEVPLKLLVSTRKGVAFMSADFCEVGCKVVKASDIKNLTIESSIVYLPEAFKNLYPKAVLNAGNIILSTVGSAAHVKNSAVGQLGRVPNELAGSLLNQNTVIFEPSSDKISEKYLFILLQMSTYRDHLDLHAHGTANQASLNISEMLSFYCVLPPFEEQQKIANFLDHETAKIDTLITKQEKLIELLKEKRQAVISHAVTKGISSINGTQCPMKDSGVEWLGEVPEHWGAKVKLADVSENNRGSFVNGPFGSDLLANELKQQGVPVIYIRDIKRTGYKRKSTVCVTEIKAVQLDVCRVTSGDVLVSKVGDPPGDSCVYPEGEPNAIITQDVIRIRVKQSQYNPLFISALLNSHFGQTVLNDISVEGTRKRVSLGDFKATRFMIPTLSEQDFIVDFINKNNKKMDVLIEKATKGIELIKERKTALISAAVTGKIDVRDWDEQGVQG